MMPLCFPETGVLAAEPQMVCVPMSRRRRVMPGAESRM